MKKQIALIISGLIFLCLSKNVTAQSSQHDLDQAELMKQFIGSWSPEIGEENSFVWEIIPFDKGYETNSYSKANGETYHIGKGIIGFSLAYQTVNMFSLMNNGTLWRDYGKFVSDKKIIFERYNADHSQIELSWEVSFPAPDKSVVINKWVSDDPETWEKSTWIRLKETVKSKETYGAPTTQQKFDNIDVWIKTFEDPDRDKWQKPEEVVKSLNLKPGDVVADIGAGDGYFTRYFTKAVSPGGKALGLDIDPSKVHLMMNDADMLESNIYEAHLIKPDNPELEPASVDVVFICNTYHHIENRVDYFKRISKSLKKNGRLVIIDWYNKPMQEGPPVDHTLSKEVVLEEFRESGYNLTQDRDILPYQYYLVFEL